MVRLPLDALPHSSHNDRPQEARHMNICPFFHEETQVLQSKEIRSDRQVADVSVIRFPWCSHRHSPVSSKVASATLGGANALTCGGSLENCPIPKEQLVDI